MIGRMRPYPRGAGASPGTTLVRDLGMMHAAGSAFPWKLAWKKEDRPSTHLRCRPRLQYSRRKRSRPAPRSGPGPSSGRWCAHGRRSGAAGRKRRGGKRGKGKMNKRRAWAAEGETKRGEPSRWKGESTCRTRPGGGRAEVKPAFSQSIGRLDRSSHLAQSKSERGAMRELRSL